MTKRNDIVDIMHLRKDYSDLCWILKDYESKISFFNNYKSKEFLKQSILESLNFKYDLKLLADKSKKSETELMKEAAAILNGMSHNIGMNSIRLMGYTLSKIIKQIYDHVYVNKDQIQKVREAFGNSHVILLPTHRSYADFLLMSYVMFHFNLPMPVIAAAMDFMNMRLVGELLRSCGAFFIRRSFASDDMYWTVFSNYIKALVKLAQEPLEFFIEGTRSRTNKSLVPKIGMLGIVLELWLSTFCDVTIVPISISYDRILEEKLYAWEMLGVPKPKESTSGLFKVRHLLNEQFGNIYFNIGEPISLSALAASSGIKRGEHNLQLRFKPSLFEKEKQFLRQFAYKIVESQQRHLIVCDWSIVVLILLQCGPVQDAVLNDIYVQLCDLLVKYGATLAPPYIETGELVSAGKQAVDRAIELHSSLVVRSGGTVGLIGRHHDLVTGHLTPENLARTETAIVDRIHLGSCRNPLLFHVARQSILLSRIRHGGYEDVAGVVEDFRRVLELLSREFIYEGCSQSNLDLTLDKLRTSTMLLNQWHPNEQHPCYLIVESAVSVHMAAYAVYGHLVVTAATDMDGLSMADKCKRIQQQVIQMCVSHGPFGEAHLEMCSLDMIRNFMGQYSGMSRTNCVTDKLRWSLASVGRCLSMDTREQLAGCLPGIFACQ